MQCLVHVPKLRVPVTKVPNLSFASPVKTVITLAQVALPILPLAVTDTEDSQDENANLATQVDGVTCWILWCIFGGVCPSRDDTTSSTQSDDIRCGHGANGRSCCIIRCPGEEARTTRESTDCDKEDATVADIRIACPSHDTEASNGGKSEHSKVDATAVGLIRGVRDSNGDETGADVWRYGVKLRFRGCPAEVVQDCGLGDVSIPTTLRDGFNIP